MIPEGLYEFFDALHIEYASDAPLRAHSTFRIGGIAELAVYPDTAEKLALCLGELCRRQIRFFIIGNGSNILFGDGVIEGVFVFTGKLSALECNGTTLRAEAGASLAAAAGLAADNGLSGLEFARGIPGTVGGALCMNAGAYGGEMSDVTVRSFAFDIKRGATVTLTEHGFSYRHSVYTDRDDLVCLGAEFELRAADKDDIYAKMRSLAQQRREKQPLEYASCGSYFKRPEGHFAGKLIEDCGLKGRRVGDACVSEKHAGFIVNLGDASADDVLRLEEIVRQAVRERFGVTLEREVRVIL